MFAITMHLPKHLQLAVIFAQAQLVDGQQKPMNYFKEIHNYGFSSGLWYNFVFAAHIHHTWVDLNVKHTAFISSWSKSMAKNSLARNLILEQQPTS